MLARILTAMVLLLVLVPFTLWAPPAHFSALTLVIFCGVFWEWARLLEAPIGPRLALTVAFFVLALLLVYDPYFDPQIFSFSVLGVTSVVWALWLPLTLFRLKTPRSLSGLFLAFLGCFAAFWAVWHARYEGLMYLFSVLMIVWIADTAAYFSGKAFGRHRLAPTISPGKTWEGVAGAILLNLGVMWLFSRIYPESWAARLFHQLGDGGLLLAVLGLTAYSVMADLHQSLLKRQAGVKDSGRLLPGHGGAFDRLDAVLVIVPMAIWLELIAKA